MPTGKLLALYGICTSRSSHSTSSGCPRPRAVSTNHSWATCSPRSRTSQSPRAFYLVYVVGIVALAVVPGIREGAMAGALWRGALFGFLAYATYDLTNLATIQGWPWQVSVIDMIWGTTLNTAVAAVGYWAGTSGSGSSSLARPGSGRLARRVRAPCARPTRPSPGRPRAECVHEVLRDREEIERSIVSGDLPMRLLSTSTDTVARTVPMTGRSVSSMRCASTLATR